MPDLVFHLGYPKTGTTTLQTHIFPRHPDIDYQGKFIPAHDYRDERVFAGIRALQTVSSFTWDSGKILRELVNEALARSTRSVLLYSSENFLHPDTGDIGLVAARLRSLFPDAKFIMTFREQADLLLSFYRSHGAFLNYVFTAKAEGTPLVLPISIEEWMTFQFSIPHKNVLGTLYYDKVAQSFIDQCGRDKIHFSLFEVFRDHPRDYLADMFSFLKIDLGTIDRLWRDQVENKGVDKRRFDELSKDLHCAARKRLGARGKILQFFSKLPNGMWPAQMPEPWLSETRSLFRGGNRWLANVLRLPLREYGYECES
jgi:Sulfotransferase domain